MNDWRPILIDSPGKNVVLVLASNEMVTWKISKTENSPILNAMMTDDMCATAAATTGTLQFVDGIARMLGKEPASFTRVRKSEVRVGAWSPADVESPTPEAG